MMCERPWWTNQHVKFLINQCSIFIKNKKKGLHNITIFIGYLILWSEWYNSCVLFNWSTFNVYLICLFRTITSSSLVYTQETQGTLSLPVIILRFSGGPATKEWSLAHGTGIMTTMNAIVLRRTRVAGGLTGLCLIISTELFT